MLSPPENDSWQTNKKKLKKNLKEKIWKAKLVLVGSVLLATQCGFKSEKKCNLGKSHHYCLPQQRLKSTGFWQFFRIRSGTEKACGVKSNKFFFKKKKKLILAFEGRYIAKPLVRVLNYFLFLAHYALCAHMYWIDDDWDNW